MRHHFLVTLLSCVVFACCLSAVSQATDLDQYFSRNDPRATMTVDHSAWQKILDRYVAPSPDGINLFAYGRVSASDRKALKAYLSALQAVKVTTLNADEQRAFWINFYNALTIDVVLDHYPVKSIRDISLGGFFTVGPWKKELLVVEGRKLSLDNIEHDILRKVWRDPRVHYAVNCASMGCPNLMAKPFTAVTLDRMLTHGARGYINHPRGARVDGGKLYLSQIYSWYRKDFGTTDAEVIRHIAVYAEPKLKKQLAGIDAIAGYDYDWSLNEAK
jgi:Protein of unknown function, DUF547